MAAITLTGHRYGRLLVLRRGPKLSGSFACWYAQCDCGNSTLVRGRDLRSGNTTSCGCRRHELTKAIANLRKTHGMSRSAEFRIWMHAKMRCENPKDAAYNNYGGRGIRMCDEWKNSFEAFFAYMGERPKGLELDRIDNNGDYRPGNCRWTTRSVQMKNRRPFKTKRAHLSRRSSRSSRAST
jgi:hypothetical protein